MSKWLNNLQGKTHAEKIRILWITTATSALLLIIIWVIAQHYSARPESVDTTLFDTLKKGTKDFINNFRK